MSEDIIVNFVRTGVATPIATNIPIQLDKVNFQEASTYEGSDPHFTYRGITIMLPASNPQLLLFRDYIIDQKNIDVLTGQLRKYLIVNEPEMHSLDSHWQWVCTRVRGT